MSDQSARIVLAIVTAATAINIISDRAQAADVAKYPDWKGRWLRIASMDESGPRRSN